MPQGAHTPSTISKHPPKACPVGCHGEEITSSTRLGALGPALEGPLVGIHFLQQDIVIPNHGQQVLVDNVPVHEAAPRLLLLRDNLQARREQSERGRNGVMAKGPHAKVAHAQNWG